MKKKLRYLYDLFIGALTWVVPKKKNYLVFLPLHEKNKFSDNIKELILHTHENHYAEYKTCLLCYTVKVEQEAENKGLDTATNEISRVWALLRADHIILDAYTKRFKYGKYSFIQLWHGIGFKHVGLLRENLNKKNKNRVSRYNRIYNKCQFIVCSSKSNKERQEKAFGINRGIVTGYPRNDIFFKSDIGGIKEKLKKKYGLSDYNRVIAYTPTYRDSNTLSPFTNNFWKKLQKFLKNEKALFLIKKHPWDRHLKVPDNFSNIKDLSTKINNTQELLLMTDLLITDYSSIMTDFAITGRPILLYTYDMEEYLANCRTFYYDIKEILPKPFIYDEKELLSKIKDSAWQQDSEVQESYKNFQQKFHQYLDGNSSKRVMEEIKKL